MKKLIFIVFALFAAGSSFSQNTTGSFTDARDGKVYKTVKIGNQEWMAENLAAKTFISGEPIMEVVEWSDWKYALQNHIPAYTYQKPGKQGSLMYNWWAVNSPDVIAPAGWSVPTVDDWKVLGSLLGADAGTKLKSTTGWYIDGDKNGNGNNLTGFNGTPSNSVEYVGNYYISSQGFGADYWCSTTETTGKYIGKPMSASLFWADSKLSISTIIDYYTGFAVRCIKSNLPAPEGKNRYNASKRRQGGWLIYFDSSWKPIADRTKATFYRVAVYNDGKLVGPIRDFYSTGVVQSTGYLLSENPDVLDGEFKSYYPSGQPYRVSNYKNGKLSGKITTYYDTGSVWIVENYIDGVSNGDYVEYWDDSVLKVKAFMVNNVPNGDVVFYNRMGQIKSKETYVNGVKK